MTSKSPLTYKDTGVDIDAQHETLARAKDAIRASFTPGVVGDVGAFGGLFDLARAEATGELLVASADGVGTKIEVARLAQTYDTVGRDLVNHCVNDVLVQGARPLFFLDYLGVGRLEPEVASQVIRGCAEACSANGLALLGGETAEMPGTYRDGDFDLVGFLVGSVRRERLLDGSRVRPGQRLLGLSSSGLHTNGFSLARAVIFDRLGWSVEERPSELNGASVGEALLAVHRSYLSLLWPLLENDRIAALAHITGGGLPDNLPRALGGHGARIDRTVWEWPALFRAIVDGGSVPLEDAFRTLNMGIGMVLVVDPDLAGTVTSELEGAGETVAQLGEVTADGGRVQWSDAL